MMLCITADGHKLPPFVIFKRKTIPKKEKFSNDDIVRVQEKGWMTTDLMIDWINLVWSRWPDFSRQSSSMLVLDAFKGHLTNPVKTLLKAVKSDLVVIPGGMTSQLQPLDVSVNI